MNLSVRALDSAVLIYGSDIVQRAVITEFCEANGSDCIARQWIENRTELPVVRSNREPAWVVVIDTPEEGKQMSLQRGEILADAVVAISRVSLRGGVGSAARRLPGTDVVPERLVWQTPVDRALGSHEY